jgi:hypothetical protein
MTGHTCTPDALIVQLAGGALDGTYATAPSCALELGTVLEHADGVTYWAWTGRYDHRGVAVFALEEEL